MTKTPKPSELVEEWRDRGEKVGRQGKDTLCFAMKRLADELEASLAAHPMVPVADLFYFEDTSEGEFMFRGCRIGDCFFRYYSDGTVDPHADWCPVGKAVAT